MQAYEFRTKPENGVIRIPEEYRSRITSNVKVIILESKSDSANTEDAHTKHKSALLLPPTLNTSNWKFSREEANER